MDHDHTRYQTGKSGWKSTVKHRGLLCNRCNVGLSLIENKQLRVKALRYLRSHQA